MKIKMMRGFTLVELLIVIALIGILAVAVLATINPIEQTNKARDAKFKNDAAEVLSAYERYYAAVSAYPWNTNDSGVGTSVAADVVVAIGSTDPGFGIVSVAAAGFTGALIETSELKTSFAGKEEFDTSKSEIDMLYTFHSSSGSSYVCFHPKANANRTGPVGLTLKCMTLGTASNATLVDIDDTCVAETDWGTLALGATRANLLCVPEGSIQ